MILQSTKKAENANDAIDRGRITDGKKDPVPKNRRQTREEKKRLGIDLLGTIWKVGLFGRNILITRGNKIQDSQGES